jgi:hypothetical protein
MKAVKHAYLDELAAFAQRGQSLIAYYHADRIAPVGQQAHRRLTDLTGGVPCSRSPPYAPPAAPPDLVQAARDDMLFCAYVSGPRVRPVIVTLMVIQFEWHIPFSLLSARPPMCR